MALQGLGMLSIIFPTFEGVSNSLRLFFIHIYITLRTYQVANKQENDLPETRQNSRSHCRNTLHILAPRTKPD